jgi:hypothetical protein
MNTTKTSAGTEQGNPVVAHVLWMQSDLQERLKVVKRLQDAISSREAEIAESRAKVPDLSHRGAEREDLAASVAIGEAPESALRDLDALIAAERKEAGELKARADEIAADASQVISGLHRKLQVENAALAEAQGEMARAQRAMVRRGGVGLSALRRDGHSLCQCFPPDAWVGQSVDELGRNTICKDCEQVTLSCRASVLRLAEPRRTRVAGRDV